MTRLLKCVCCGQAGEAGGLPPVHLQTVCSGTDAPAIALSIASKALAAEGVHLQVRHEMSCEKEPFKQAYIARNFPGVPVFSDVVELAERAAAGKGQAGAAMATTSFGGERAIPDAAPGELKVPIATSCRRP